MGYDRDGREISEDGSENIQNELYVKLSKKKEFKKQNIVPYLNIIKT